MTPRETAREAAPPLALLGQGAIITGASRGLGREIARHFARAGAHVALLARDPAALEEAAEEVRAEALQPGQLVLTKAVDLTDDAALGVVLRECLQELPDLGILVNNAAVQGPIGSFEKQDPRAWRDVFALNLYAAAECCRQVLPQLKARGRGKIINLSGGGATGPRPDFSAYAAAKAALVRLSETLAQEWREHRIDVNCVAPGAMNTRMWQELLAAGPERAPHEYARAREQEQTGGTSPAIGAELVLFLASAASDGITGRLLSAVWDDWRDLPARRTELAATDLYTLRRIVPRDRGLDW